VLRTCRDFLLPVDPRETFEDKWCGFFLGQIIVSQPMAARQINMPKVFDSCTVSYALSHDFSLFSDGICE